MSYTEHQVEEFRQLCNVPPEIIVSIRSDVTRLLGVCTRQFHLVLLPEWQRRGFKIVQAKMDWEARGGKVFRVREEHLRGEIPLDIAPLV